MFDDDEEITVDFLKTKGSQLFFPQGVSKYGGLSEMKLQLGNFAQESISAFTDPMGEECTFQDYLKSHGLCSTKFYIYLMSTLTGEEGSFPGKVDPIPLTMTTSPGDEKELVRKNVFMGSSKTELAGEFETLQMTSTPTKDASPDHCHKVNQTPLFGLALKENEETLCTADTASAHRVVISYELITESSYSDVVMTSLSFSRKDCFDVKSVSDPLTQDIDIDEFDPLEHGFTVVDIWKGDKCFLDKHFKFPEAACDDPLAGKFKYVFPQAVPQAEAAKSNRLILHPPSEVWGYDGNKLIIGVVASCHMATSALYVWYRNGSQYKQGNKLCCIATCEPGQYTVEVQYGKERDVSEPVFIRPWGVACSVEKNVSYPDTKKSSYRGESSGSNPPKSDSLLPVVEKEEIVYSSKDEIGRGSFGVVYKGVWAEELLFGDGNDKETLNIETCDKLDAGKQVCQAVAYLHNLKPPVVHRDIKPANVMVARATHKTKLCDMGLSKLKSTQSLSKTTTTSVPGTPFYMAPECIVGKKKATIQSDVWSLACTLLELFTQKDCWEDVLEDKAASVEEEGQNDGIVNPLIDVMKAEAVPGPLQLLSSSTVGASFEQILKGCFQYDSDKRPGAIDLVHAFP
ncbi:hypothetical protein OS493_033415 [Desmophyllum pertusum]|uniref:Protein kinase domain-containing protein n=1 Tax=Desmophyllum pertusum TaxID=174260 RepID=A0A9W9Y809_9CNID|nr:hypothetical protein OS493_033415 [Desmophyllum pertusum]